MTKITLERPIPAAHINRRDDADHVRTGDDYTHTADETGRPLTRDVDQVQPGDTATYADTADTGSDVVVHDTVDTRDTEDEAVRETRVLDDTSQARNNEGGMQPYVPSDRSDTRRD